MKRTNANQDGTQYQQLVMREGSLSTQLTSVKEGIQRLESQVERLQKTGSVTGGLCY